MPRTRLILEYQVNYALPEQLSQLAVVLESLESMEASKAIADTQKLIAETQHYLAQCRHDLAAPGEPRPE